ncbi:hypothetical protein QBC46DRAFT_343037 [Diplogelasinospora grovesii]|uniref:Uncharacterized protein n=1 Tax=Diplogelasinospora grovesii TaxID=303347 RepID=A0AAN6N4F4_9PEZI|nr:hypothetical protein QBC46DRAFT_343037 [Diplogelasinospora grovesii]
MPRYYPINIEEAIRPAKIGGWECCECGQNNNAIGDQIQWPRRVLPTDALGQGQWKCRSFVKPCQHQACPSCLITSMSFYADPRICYVGGFNLLRRRIFPRGWQCCVHPNEIMTPDQQVCKKPHNAVAGDRKHRCKECVLVSEYCVPLSKLDLHDVTTPGPGAAGGGGGGGGGGGTKKAVTLVGALLAHQQHVLRLSDPRVWEAELQRLQDLRDDCEAARQDLERLVASGAVVEDGSLNQSFRVAIRDAEDRYQRRKKYLEHIGAEIYQQQQLRGPWSVPPGSTEAQPQLQESLEECVNIAEQVWGTTTESLPDEDYVHPNSNPTQ